MQHVYKQQEHEEAFSVRAILGHSNEYFGQYQMHIKAPDRCAQLFDREGYLITDKHTEVLDGSEVRAYTDRQTDKRTDGRYQTYYLP